MTRRNTPEADLQRAVVQALRFALPRKAIIQHCANEVTKPDHAVPSVRRSWSAWALKRASPI